MSAAAPLRVGTRGSPLALAQTRATVAALEAALEIGGEPDADLHCEIVEIRTTGDQILDRPLREVGGKGLFVKELDEALLDGRIDCAIHSMKDVPTELPAGVVIASVPPRADPRDALFTMDGRSLAELSPGAKIGTTSLRRQAQALAARPDFEVVMLRGNVQTRLAKLAAAECDAMFLACAGVGRLGLDPAPAHMLPLEPDVFVPAVAQGALAITAREGDGEVLRTLAALEDRDSAIVTSAERSCARVFGGGCDLPLGVYARVVGGSVTLSAIIASPNGARVVRCDDDGPADEAEAIGERLAKAVLDAGGSEIVGEILRLAEASE